jgi:hypothetical protein
MCCFLERAILSLVHHNAVRLVFVLLNLVCFFPAFCEDPPRVSVPLPSYEWEPQQDRFEMLFKGQTRFAWNFPPSAPRPFLYPLIGPSGRPVTRMGHPGAPDHDHHRSVWFAHHKVDGFDFWSEQSGNTIRQSQWLLLEQRDDGGAMAVLLDWVNKSGEVLLVQELIVDATVGDDGGAQVDVSSIWRPGAGRAQTVLQQTNFGLFAIRVSYSLSHVFGNGNLTADAGQVGEDKIFGHPHRWVDYSGQSPAGSGTQRSWFQEGITYFDHPSNPGYPNRWHVRDDGWMCASPCMESDIIVTAERPLQLRYLLDVHPGLYDPQRAQEMHEKFAKSAMLKVAPSQRPHVKYQLEKVIFPVP